MWGDSKSDTDSVLRVTNRKKKFFWMDTVDSLIKYRGVTHYIILFWLK